jgi:hypothetical protein
LEYHVLKHKGISTEKKNAVSAGLSLRLAWLYRAGKNEEQEKRFLGIALNAYEESFIHSDFAATSFVCRMEIVL